VGPCQDNNVETIGGKSDERRASRRFFFMWKGTINMGRDEIR
jgi:hypothetical protein